MRYAQFIRNHLDVRQEGGDEFLVLCPFHGDTNPSMYVNVSSGKWICHACNAKGNIDRLAERLNLVVTDGGVPTDRLKQRLKAVRDKATAGEQFQGYSDEWLDQFDFPHPYWESRGLSEETVDRFDLGYDPKRDCVTIPLRDSRSRVVGVIRRRLDGQRPKYMYPKGFAIGKHLFGAHLVRKSKHKKVALVEGSLDAIACWDARIPAMGLLGSRLTYDQATLIRSLGIKTVVVFTDNDKAGFEAVPQIKEMLPGIQVRIAWYRYYWSGKDPADLKPQQRRKAFHSSLTLWEWAEKVTAGM